MTFECHQCYELEERKKQVKTTPRIEVWLRINMQSHLISEISVFSIASAYFFAYSGAIKIYILAFLDE